MKKTVIVILAVFSLLILVAELRAKDNFMWEVENGNTKMYLLGSIHMMPENAYPLDEKIEKCFGESDILVIEADPTKVDQKIVQALIIQHGMYSEGKTLKSEVSPELYKRVSVLFEEFGVPMQQIDMYKPWFVCLNMAAISMQKMDMKAGIGIDVHFIEQAKEKEMEIVELESSMYQLELLTSFPEESQIAYLQYSLDNFENVETLITNILQAWMTGDSELMNAELKKKMLEFANNIPGVKEYYNKMFPERDIKIVEELDNILKSKEKKTYFIVVGSGHLIGDDGLLQLLKDKGYKTKQL